MDNEPITAASLAKPYHIDASNFERAYRDHLSGYKEWAEKDHAEEWMLFPENIGERVCIDETSVSNGELYTFVTNTEGHARKGTLIAWVKGTKVEDVVKVLSKLTPEQAGKVKVVTLDLSESMASIVSACFPNACQTIDRYHVQKLAAEAVQEERLTAKRAAARQQVKEKEAFKKRLARNIRRRKNKSAKAPQGRKPGRKNESFKPFRYPNGDTRVELLTRSRYLLMTSGNHWSESQKIRWELISEHYPQVAQAYQLSHSLRCRFNEHHNDYGLGFGTLFDWCMKARQSGLETFQSCADTIEDRILDIAHYFVNRQTNAFAESFNSIVKDFRRRLRGVRDTMFFLYRLALIFG